MNASRLAYITVVAFAALAAASQADAQTVASHPALRAAAPAPASTTIDPNHFIVGHPAGGLQRAGHANYAHPAVTVSAQGAPALDVNHFLVQPPSSVHWVDAPAQPVQVAAAR